MSLDEHQENLFEDTQQIERMYEAPDAREDSAGNASA
jgi:hypothetical protein